MMKFNCFKRQELGKSRLVYINNPARNVGFSDNAVTNTKYTWYNFLFKNLFEQFRWTMNQYFLAIACLQLIPQITPVNALTTWVPLAVIFAVTAIKEGLDDLGRWKADNEANGRLYSVIRNGREVFVPSRDIAVGDILRLVENAEVPADCVVLSTADPKGLAYIQTTNLDGESNLKVRSAPATTQALNSLQTVSGFQGVIECSHPNEHLYSFDSQLRIQNAIIPLSSDQLLLQATHVRNTPWLFAVVVYTGNETKFGKNKKIPPTKATRTDNFINNAVRCIFVFQLVLVIIFGIIGNARNDSYFRLKAWYMHFTSSDDAGYMILIIPARFLLLNSTMIPISIKLTLDLCKLFYSRFIDNDMELYDKETDMPAKSNSTALSEDLGQIKYILTDKTGTLTENKMIVKAAVVNGQLFGAPINQTRKSPAPPSSQRLPDSLDHGAKEGIMVDTDLYDNASTEYMGTLTPEAIQSTPAPGTGQPSVMTNTNVTYCDAGYLEFLRCLALNNDVIPSMEKASDDGGSIPPPPPPPPPGAHILPIHSPGTTPPATNDLSRRIRYKASSPDEEALVKAAAAYGVALAHREAETVSIAMTFPSSASSASSAPGTGTGSSGSIPPVVYETFGTVVMCEFNSNRKRMSVLVRAGNTPNGMLRLYTKGADDVILPLLAHGQDATIANTMQTVDLHAASGLRTLLYAYRDVSEHEYRIWDHEFQEASASLEDREAKKERCYEALERDLVLLGATAIEDKLQSGVPETIALLKSAGISFWMLTGDKFSTALTIANTANLKPASTDLVTLEGDDDAEIAQAIDFAYTSLQEQGHDFTIAPPPSNLEIAKQIATCQYTPYKPPAPVTASNTQSYTAAYTSPLPHAIVAVGAGTGAGTGGPNHHPAPGTPSMMHRRPYTVIFRGNTLQVAASNRRLSTRLRAMLCSADSVIACRVTPKQKGMLVQMIQEMGHLALAIGDGGNDVNMIQVAGIGVGIRGKEGLQASRAADYQVSYFRAIARLILIHGRFSYYRTSVVAQYSLYKSLYFCFMQIGFGFVSGFAGVSLFNSLCVAAYNAVLFVPIVFFIIDKDVAEAIALRYPQSYKLASEGEYLNFRSVLKWAFRALWQAVITLAICLEGNKYTKSANYESLGLLVFMAYLTVQDFTMLLALRRIALRNIISVFGMHLLAMLAVFVANAMPRMSTLVDYHSFNQTIADPSFWLTQLLLVFATVLPVQFVNFWNNAFPTSYKDRLFAFDSAASDPTGMNFRVFDSVRKPLLLSNSPPLTHANSTDSVSSHSDNTKYNSYNNTSNRNLAASATAHASSSSTAAPGTPSSGITGRSRSHHPVADGSDGRTEKVENPVFGRSPAAATSGSASSVSVRVENALRLGIQNKNQGSASSYGSIPGLASPSTPGTNVSSPLSRASNAPSPTSGLPTPASAGTGDAIDPVHRVGGGSPLASPVQSVSTQSGTTPATPSAVSFHSDSSPARTSVHTEEPRAVAHPFSPTGHGTGSGSGKVPSPHGQKAIAAGGSRG